LLDLGAKQLELVKDTLGEISAVELLRNPTVFSRQYTDEVQKAADILKIAIHVTDIGSPNDLKQAFSSIASARPNAVLLVPDGPFYQQRKHIADLAIQHKVPMIGAAPQMTDAGALMSYGANINDLFHRAASYVDKILKGANPADVPIEQPTKFEFVINARTAKTIGLTIPPTVLARADKVID
jgi:putative tryptophan/tyrosine transport system substrate-binding protein